MTLRGEREHISFLDINETEVNNIKPRRARFCPKQMRGPACTYSSVERKWYCTWKAENMNGEGLGTPINRSGLNSKQSFPHNLQSLEAHTPFRLTLWFDPSYRGDNLSSFLTPRDNITWATYQAWLLFHQAMYPSSKQTYQCGDKIRETRGLGFSRDRRM